MPSNPQQRSNTKHRHKLSPRSLARSLAVQGLYFYRLNPTAINIIEECLQESPLFAKANYELLHELLTVGSQEFDVYLQRYKIYSSHEVDNIDSILQIVLVIAAIELINYLTIPVVVIINEAIEVTKIYGSNEAYKLVNNLIDQLAREVRANEMLARQK